MSLLVMSFGDRIRMSRTGGGGWLYLQGANSMAMSGLHCRKAWLVPGSPFLTSFLHKWT